MSAGVSSQRYFRNSRRRLINSARRESRFPNHMTPETRRDYVPMTQTPLTPVVIRSLPVHIRRVLQVLPTLDQSPSRLTLLVNQATGQPRDNYSDGRLRAVIRAKVATPLDKNIHKIEAISDVVVPQEYVTYRPIFERLSGLT